MQLQVEEKFSVQLPPDDAPLNDRINLVSGTIRPTIRAIFANRTYISPVDKSGQVGLGIAYCLQPKANHPGSIIGIAQAINLSLYPNFQTARMAHFLAMLATATELPSQLAGRVIVCPGMQFLPYECVPEISVPSVTIGESPDQTKVSYVGRNDIFQGSTLQPHIGFLVVARDV